MNGRMYSLLLMVLAMLMLLSCSENIEQAEERSGVFAPAHTYTLPDGWNFDSLPALSYDADSDTVTVDVHRDLAPLADGFVPSVYTTATLQSDGTLLSIAGFPEYSTSITVPKSKFTPQLPDGIIQKIFSFENNTAVIETLHTAHTVGLLLTVYDEHAIPLFSVSPADAFDYNLSRDIGAAESGGTHFHVMDLKSLRRNDGVELLCVLTSEGLAAYTLDGQLTWILTKGTPTAMMVIAQAASTMYSSGSSDPDALLDTLLLLCEERGTQTLYVVDTIKGTYGDPVSLPASLTENVSGVRMLTGAGYDLYVKNSRGFFGLTLRTTEGVMGAEAVLLCDWALSELAPSDIMALAVIDADHFLIASHDAQADEDFSTLYRYVYIRPQDVKHKEEIILAKLCNDFNLQFAVRAFNRSSDTHRIVIRDYTDISDPETRKLRLDTDIAAGAIPDLYLFPGGQEGIFSYEKMLSDYENAGVFCDLTALFSSHTDFAQKELLSVVTKPFQNTEGEQYRFPLAYTIGAYVGHAPDFPAIPTLADMCAVLNDLPDGVYADKNYAILRRDLIDAALAASYDEETAACSFTDGSMEALLSALAQWENAPMFPENDAPLKDLFKNGKLCLLRTTFDSPLAYRNLSMELGDDAVIIGAPNDEGTFRAVLDVRTYLSVSAVSAHPTEVLDFLSIYFSVNAAATVGKAYFTQADIDAYYDEYADQTFIENGEKSGVVYDSVADNYPGIHYKLTREDCAAYADFLSSISRRVYVNPAISDIFWEEYGAQGDKSLAEMLSVVQSRCEIYLSERN